MALIEIRDLVKTFKHGGSTIVAVDSVSLTIEPATTMAVIGESGSGKTTLGRLMLGLLRADSGSVRFADDEITAMSEKQLRRLRSRMQVVFQEPFESLNPRMRVCDIVAEPLEIHEPTLTRKAREGRVAEVFETVGVADRLRRRFPVQLSGGEQQRVGIARAIITQPDFIVLDEPTSSLDVSMRAGILSLLQTLRARLGLTYCFISHDISTVEYLSGEVAVLYQGRVVEAGATTTVIRAPQHPYTKRLMSARLSVDPRERLQPAPPDAADGELSVEATP